MGVRESLGESGQSISEGRSDAERHSFGDSDQLSDRDVSDNESPVDDHDQGSASDSYSEASEDQSDSEYSCSD